MSSSHVVITGCTRGLGGALVHRFIEAGWTVSGCARAEAGIQTLQAKYATPHRFEVVDVSDARRVADWAHGVVQSNGAPQLLLNNAALMNTPAPLWEIDVDEFARLMQVNVNGSFYVLKAFLPAMIEAGRGVLVNYSSGWGRSTAPEVAPYCATKWAIEGLTQGLAQELPTGLAAVALNPGIIDTDMLRSCWADEAGHFPDAEEWSHRAIKFLTKLGPKDNGRSLNLG